MNMLLLLLLLIVVVQTESNPYQMLGVSRDANDQQIRKAFKELSLKYHPDLAVTHDERYAQIINAYELLKDPQIRRQYDLTSSASTVRHNIDHSISQPSHSESYDDFSFSFESNQGGFFDIEQIFRKTQQQMRKSQQQHRRHMHKQHNGQYYKQRSNFNIQDNQFEAVNYIDEFGRLRTAIVRRPKGLLALLKSLITEIVANPFQSLLVCMLAYFIVSKCIRIR